MSYDVWVYMATGAGSSVSGERRSVTGNVRGMFLEAVGSYGRAGQKREGITGLSGMRCSDALPIVTAGIEYMEAHAEEMRAHEPRNGWGSYEGALSFLRWVRDQCVEHPIATLAVWS